MIVNGNTYTVGADPEVFVCNPDGSFKSAHGLVPGTKRKPHPTHMGAVQVDGMALEFNINPAKDLGEFVSHINTVKSSLQGMIGELQVMKCASVHFDEEFLASVPNFNKRMGCEGDYNGWTLSDNIPPNSSTLMRTAGGHVHIGGIFSKNPFAMPHFETSARLARILDLTLGLPSLFWDYDDERRSMYGKAGCFRPKKYGMEYRTLSNRWIFDKQLITKVYEGVEQALYLYENPTYEPPAYIKEVIDSSDRVEAAKILDMKKVA